MQEYWKTKEFKALRKKTYDILRKSGFVDIERPAKGQHPVLMAPPSSYRLSDKEGVSLGKEDYYRLLGHRIHTEKWISKLDKQVMAWRAEAKSLKDMSRELKARRLPYSRWTLRLIIMKYEDKWGVVRRG